VGKARALGSRYSPWSSRQHEVGANLYLGPPKTADSARDIHLPPFLIAKLRALLDSHDNDVVFTGARGGLLRRSSMSRRVFAPAVNGIRRSKGVPMISSLVPI
jgi:hypothetical protein